MEPDRAARVTARAAETFDIPESHFLQKLRVYVQHYMLPSLTFTMRGKDNGDGSFTREVNLPVAELRRFEQWNVGAKEYLDGVGDHVPLLDVVRRYRDRVEGFQNWLEKDVREMYAAELAERRDVEHELVLAELEDDLDTARRPLPNGLTPPKDEVFIHVFSSEDTMGYSADISLIRSRASRST